MRSRRPWATSTSSAPASMPRPRVSPRPASALAVSETMVTRSVASTASKRPPASSRTSVSSVPVVAFASSLPGSRVSPSPSAAPGTTSMNLGPNTDSGSMRASAVAGTPTPPRMEKRTSTRPSGSSSKPRTVPMLTPRIFTSVPPSVNMPWLEDGNTARSS